MTATLPVAVRRGGAARIRVLGTLGALAAFAAGNLVLAALLVTGRADGALLIALLPVLLVAAGALVASDRSILAFAALALPVSVHPLNAPLPVGAGPEIYASDVLVVLAILSWAVSRLVGGRAGSPRRHFASGVLGLPLTLFAAAAMWAALRGHEHYGASLFGEPFRLVAYAGIGLALCDLDARRAYRGIVAVLYAGTAWMFVNVLYLLATGGSQTGADILSTGGRRVVSLSVALHLASALFLALLNLELAATARRRLAHLGVAGLALVVVVLSFGRGTFLALALGLPVLLALAPRARRLLARLLPLTLPAGAAAALGLAAVDPSIGPTLVGRLSFGAVSSGADASAEWRRSATRAILEQFHSSPLTGVGFGQGARFTLNGTTYTITQDPHNSFVWLLAGGGILLLALFGLVVARWGADVMARLRGRATPRERILLIWCALTLGTLLINAGLGPVLGDPSELLSVWVLLLLPGIVAAPDRETGRLLPEVARRVTARPARSVGGPAAGVARTQGAVSLRRPLD